MSFLPRGTSLGKLEIIEVYEFYDEPILFSCKNESTTFLVVALVEDIWLYAGISPTSFQDVRLGQIDLYTAFSTSDSLYQVNTGDIPIAEFILSIDDNQLPMKGEYL